jgi:DNA-binding MarR family transcriptional regulator
MGCHRNEYGLLDKRNRIICEAFKLYAYTQTEIADYLGLDRTTISKIVRKTNKKSQARHNSRPDPFSSRKKGSNQTKCAAVTAI